jgi:hypothetical protein
MYRTQPAGNSRVPCQHARGIRLEHGRAHAKRVEEGAAREFQIVFGRAAQRLPDHAGENRGGAARILPARAGRGVERLARRERGLVGLREDHEGDVGERVVVVLVEVEAARHAQHFVERDPRSRVVSAAPLRHERRCIERKPAFFDEHAHEHPGHALRHRPADERRLTREAGRIALRNHLAAIHDDQCARASRLARVRFVEGAVDGRAQLAHVHVRGRRGGRQRGRGGRRPGTHVLAREAQCLHRRAERQRAAEAGPEFGLTRGEAEEARAGLTPLDVHRSAHQLQQGMDARHDVFADHRIGRPAGHEHARAQDLGRIAGADRCELRQHVPRVTERGDQRQRGAPSNQYLDVPWHRHRGCVLG